MAGCVQACYLLGSKQPPPGMCAIFAQDGVHLRPVCTPSCPMTEPIFSRVLFCLWMCGLFMGGGELAAVGVKKSLVKIVHNFIFRLFWIIFAWFSR